MATFQPEVAMHVEPHHTAEQLAALIRGERRAKVARRLDAVRLAMHGHTAAEVGERVLLSDRQVRAWVARYNGGGTDVLADRPGRGRKGPLAGDEVERLKARLRAGPTPADGGVCVLRGEDVVRILAAEFGLVRSLSAVYDLVWAERGTRPTAPKQTAYGNLYVLTAVCPATGRAEGLVSPALNTAVVQTFLDQLSATIPRRTHVVLVWDGAGYHSASGALVVPANITAITLPPYSPELNPVERRWLYLREHYWSNRVYPDIDALEQAAVAGWQAVCLRPDRVKTVCRCEYLTGGN